MKILKIYVAGLLITSYVFINLRIQIDMKQQEQVTYLGCVLDE